MDRWRSSISVQSRDSAVACLRSSDSDVYILHRLSEIVSKNGHCRPVPITCNNEWRIIAYKI